MVQLLFSKHEERKKQKKTKTKYLNEGKCDVIILIAFNTAGRTIYVY